MSERKYTDAQYPNAGNDFHVVWTIRKCLELLHFHEQGLMAVAIENLDPEDSKLIDEDGDVLLGVDLTEYYGGKHFMEATKVVVSQLKYSTVHPTVEWTASKLCTGRKGKTGSAIQRLATIFHGFEKRFGREAVLDKLKLKLVTNRPIAPGLISLQSAARDANGTDNKSVSLASFQKLLTSINQEEVKKIAKASTLPAGLVVDFLSILDFSDCASDSRVQQAVLARRDIESYGVYDAKSQYSKLYLLVKDKTMPSAVGNNVLFKEDILFEFEFPDITSLFPVPAKFNVPISIVEREQLSSIYQTLESDNCSILCLHGGAGIGKSTLIQSLANHLSQRDTVILFDCYGGGSYLDVTDRRHKHEKALLFLSNELAIQTASPFLLKRQQGYEFYIDEFHRRIEFASRVVAETNPDAKIVLIIDAADNSVTAAKKAGDRCFVHDIVKMPLPKNVRLVVTTRTERLVSLLLPQDAIQMEIAPFSKSETDTFILSYFGDVTDEERTAFFVATKAIPRVMSYALQGEGEMLSDKLKPLPKNGATLNEIFRLLIKQAAERSGEDALTRTLFTTLITLPRPVPLSYLLRVAGLSKHFVEDYAVDIWGGLVYENEVFNFRDEDFEKFLQDEYQPSVDDQIKIADDFLAHADTDEYASIHLGVALQMAGYSVVLQDIVLSKSSLKLPMDQVRNKEVFIDRARLAMRATTGKEHQLRFLQLQAVTAEVAKTDSVLQDVMIKQPELAVLFNDTSTSRKVYNSAGNPQWFGRVHLRSAALLSRNTLTMAQAKIHLVHAEDWIRYRNNLSAEKLDRYDISEKDLAFGAEAYLRLYGPQNCLDWFYRWRPKRFVFKSVAYFIDLILSSTPIKQVYDWLQPIKTDPAVLCLINALFFEKGLKPPFSIERISPIIPLYKRAKKKLDVKLKQSLMSMAEQMAQHSKPYSEIEPVLDICLPEPFYNMPGFFDGIYGEKEEKKLLDLFFRGKSLISAYTGHSLQVMDLLPIHLQGVKDEMDHKEKQKIDEQQKRFTAFYQYLLPVYETRIRLVTGKADSDTATKNIAAVLDRHEKDYEISHRYVTDSRYFPRYLAASCTELVFFMDEPASLIELILKGFRSKSQDITSILVDTADRLSIRNVFANETLRILAALDEEIERLVMSGSEQIDVYARATIIASRVSELSGREYFDKLVASSATIDQEAHDQIRFMDQLVEAEHFKNPTLAFLFSRFVEYCSERLKGGDGFPWDHATRSIAKLDTISAFAIGCRWDHRGTRTLTDYFGSLLHTALSNGTIDHLTIAGLLPLNVYYWTELSDLLTLLIAKYNEAGNSRDKNLFVERTIENLMVNCDHRNHYKILLSFRNAINDGRFLKKEPVDDFKAYCAKLGTVLGKDEEGEDIVERESALRTEQTDVFVLPTGIDVTDVFALEKLLVSNGVSRRDYRDDRTDSILTAVLAEVQPEKYLSHLDALIAISPDILGYYSFQSALDARLNQWSLHGDVKVWKRNNFARVIRSRFSSYLRYDEELSFYSLKTLADSFGVIGSDLADVVISILPDFINYLSAESLWQLFDVTAAGLTTADKETFILWLLPRWNETVPPDYGDGIDPTPFFPGNDFTEILPSLLRYHLGHPDKRVRWRAAKSLLCLQKYGVQNLLPVLFKRQDERSCGVCQHKNHLFFWLAAKLWLWITLDKLASEGLINADNYAKPCLEALRCIEYPHAQIQLFMKSTCLTFCKREKDVYQKEELAEIRSVLTSKLPKNEGKKKHITKYDGYNDHNFDFQFSSIHTIEDWYVPLGRVFNFTGYQIAHFAEKYIRGEWGYVGNAKDDDHVHGYDYELTSGSDSKFPVVEDLRTYYEYHSMQCVAGELIKTVPLFEEEHYYTTWDDWLEDFGLLRHPYWLSEKVKPLPLLPVFWKERRDYYSGWQWDIQQNTLKELAGFVNPEKPGYLILQGGATIHYGKDYESQNVRSALVPPDLAGSLLRAMQTGSLYDHFMDMEKHYEEGEGDNDEVEEDDEEDEDRVTGTIVNRFTLEPWIGYIENHKCGEDEYDVSCSSVDKGYIVPGRVFSDWAKLQLSPDRIFSYRSGKRDSPVTILHNWGNQDHKESYGSFTSEGQRLYIKTEELLNFLKETNKVLLVKTEMYRKPERDRFNDEYSWNMSYYTLYYLIKQDGTVETLSGDFRIG